MPPSRFTHDQLVDKALAAVTEAAGQRLHEHPVAKSRALRFAFAYLANGQDSRAAFDELWQALTAPIVPDENSAQNFGRQQTINCLCRFIHRMHGRPPPERPGR